MPKRQLVEKTPSNSKLIVPASASSAADRAPRSRYLRAGTAFLAKLLLIPNSIQLVATIHSFACWPAQ
jgi:hypothetical protein